MTKRTEARLDSWEKSIYNEGQALIREGKEKMQRARELADQRVAAEEKRRSDAIEQREARERENLARGSRAIIEDLLKVQGLGYRVNVTDYDIAVHATGNSAIITLTLKGI